MARAMVVLVTLMLLFPSRGSAQAAPSLGDRVRVRRADGTVLTGTLATRSTGMLQLSTETVGGRIEIPVSAIEALETSLGRSPRFEKYYGITVAVSTVVGGIVGLTRGNQCTNCGDLAGGLLLGYLVGIPLGGLVGSQVTEERWSRAPSSGSAQLGPEIRPATGSALGLSVGQRIRVQAADGLRIEGVFSGFEGRDTLFSTTEGGQAQRVPIDRMRAVWVRERSTGKGARIGAITGAIFGVVAGMYIDNVIDHSDCRSCRPDPLGIGLLVGVVGAGAGAALGAGIGFLVQRWSPVWP